MGPASIAIIGMSSKPGSPGRAAIQNLVNANFPAELYLVGRSGGEIDGRPVHTSIDELPEDIDLGIITLPAAAVPDAVAACVRRKMGGAIVFASGFAEVGAAGDDGQRQIVESIGDSGFGLIGPNCLGLNNFLNGLAVFLFAAPPAPVIAPLDHSAVGLVGQSGGLVQQLRQTLSSRGIPVSYSVTTGNEADLDLCDFIRFYIHDRTIATIGVYTEQIKRPAEFLAVAELARGANKSIVMMHPGKSAKGRNALQSHTGALAGDNAVMRTIVEAAGVLVVDTLEEWHDACEMMARFPKAPTKGTGLITFSGALCGIAHDYSEDIGIEFPTLEERTLKTINDRLPDFVGAKNPVDLTTQPAFEPDLLGLTTRAILDDPNIGSVAISIPFANKGDVYLDGLIPLIEGNEKPLAITPMADGRPLPDTMAGRIHDAGVVIHYSPERMLRTIAKVTEFGRQLALTEETSEASAFADLPEIGLGAQPEWRGKKILAAINVPVPPGQLVETADEATQVAATIGYPVAIKAQSKTLPHKTEAGGVIVELEDEASLRRAWDGLHANIRNAMPGLLLDGVLVEAMAGIGVELVVGARRDPQWGPVLLVGLGGVWVEALGDVRLMPANASKERIETEVLRLKSAKLLRGFRVAPPADIDAVVDAAAAVGRLMATRPDIVEVDINPLVVHGKGKGVTALDALIVVRE